MARTSSCCCSLFECFKSSSSNPSRLQQPSSQNTRSFLYSYSPYETPPTSSLTTSLENPGYRLSPSTTDLELGVEVLYKSRIQRYSVSNQESKPKLECIIVPSYGSSPPSSVAVKKEVASDFLKGVGDDFHIIQRLIEEDSYKELGKVQMMCHFEKVRLAKFIEMIEDRMKSSVLRHTGDNQKGLLIWYTGHGERETGNWVFKDGCLKFEDIYHLYKKYFKGRYLYIVTDCCYSGAWVEECARLLDENGIKCGHIAKRKQVYIKVFAACLPDEPAHDKFYTKCKGVKLHSHEDHSKSIKFAEHRKLHLESRKGDTDTRYSQTTLGVDFTQTNSCILGENERCLHHSTWTEHVQSLLRQQRSHNYLI